jgi:hypothetical protein
MNLQELKFRLSRPPRNQISFIVTTFIDEKLSKKFYGKSLVGNFLQIIYTHLAYADTTNFPASGAPWSSQTTSKDIGSVSRNTYNVATIQSNAILGAVSKGLLCGSGTTTPAAADLAPETLITHGATAGKLMYQVQTANQGCTIVSLTTSFILQRLFVNSSGGQVDVNEICWQGYYAGNSFLLYRDVLSSTDEIPDGSTYRVTLEVSVTT